MYRPAQSDQQDLTIRASTPDDYTSLSRLARGRYGPRATALIAEVGGDAAAAIGVADGMTVVDPRRSTPSIVAALRLRRIEARAIAALFCA